MQAGQIYLERSAKDSCLALTPKDMTNFVNDDIDKEVLSLPVATADGEMRHCRMMNKDGG